MTDAPQPKYKVATRARQAVLITKILFNLVKKGDDIITVKINDDTNCARIHITHREFKEYEPDVNAWTFYRFSPNSEYVEYGYYWFHTFQNEVEIFWGATAKELNVMGFKVPDVPDLNQHYDVVVDPT